MWFCCMDPRSIVGTLLTSRCVRREGCGPSLLSVGCINEKPSFGHQQEGRGYMGQRGGVSCAYSLPRSSSHSTEATDWTDSVRYEYRMISRSSQETVVKSGSQNENISPYPGSQILYPLGSLRTEDLAFMVISLIKKYFANSCRWQ